MDLSVFDYLEYKVYLRKKLELLSKKNRGYKQETAKLLGCKPSYLSQILNSKPHLTPEQAHGLNQRFMHDKVESRYFSLMVEFGKAGNHQYREFVREQLDELRKSRHDLHKRLKETDQMSKEHMDTFYSSWMYACIYIAVAVPKLQDVQKLSQRFNLPEKMVADILNFLIESGMLEKVNGKFELTKKRIHLDRNSHYIQHHHINWRSQCLQSVEKNFPDDMHFSTVFAVTEKDFARIKEVFVKAIESAREVINPSPSEEVYSITLDLFKV